MNTDSIYAVEEGEEIDELEINDEVMDSGVSVVGDGEDGTPELLESDEEDVSQVVEEGEEESLYAVDDFDTAADAPVYYWMDDGTDGSAAGIVANASIADDDTITAEEIRTNDDYQRQVLAYLADMGTHADSASILASLDDLHAEIRTLNENMVIIHQNDVLLQKFEIGFLVAIFGALIIFFFFNRLR